MLLRYPCHGDVIRGSGALPAGLREQRAGLHPSIPRASTPVTDALVSLHWLRVPERIQYEVAVLVTKFFTVVRRDTWDRSHVSPTFLVDGAFVQPPPVVSSCRPSNTPLSVAELFRMPLRPSGSRFLNMSSVHQLYSHFTSSENCPVQMFILGHSSVVNIF